jgi:hypothetical protein
MIDTIINFILSYTTEIFVSIYLFIGIISMWYYVNAKYYNELYDKKEFEHGMFNIFLLVLIILWPITLYKYIRYKLYDK